MRQHPDLPLDYDKKARHRSISTGNAATMLDPRRNSLDIAVSDFLRAERLTQRIKHPLSGRTISFSEVGDPEGAAVIICLGMGLTRYVSAFYDELASTLRLRLITIDRPGVGNSEPYPPNNKSGPLSWPDDVLAVCGAEALRVRTASPTGAAASAPSSTLVHAASIETISDAIGKHLPHTA